MAKYVNAYKILADACIKFCEDNNEFYDDIVADVFTDVLGQSYIYCKCMTDKFEFLYDWYEGGELTILNISYFDDVCDKAFYKRINRR